MPTKRHHSPNQPFSQDLAAWLRNDTPKTLGSLIDTFGEKSFAVLILFLMFFPALPLPTGGITHIFEVISVLLALEMVIGRKTIWLPQSLRQRSVSHSVITKVLPFMIRRIQWFERFSRPRLGSLLSHRAWRAFTGLLIITFCVAAFVSPPFSGLDTLPALGVVVICLALILEDVVVYGIGIGIGAIGIGITIALSSAIVTGFKALF